MLTAPFWPVLEEEEEEEEELEEEEEEEEEENFRLQSSKSGDNSNF